MKHHQVVTCWKEGTTLLSSLGSKVSKIGPNGVNVYGIKAIAGLFSVTSGRSGVVKLVYVFIMV